MDNQSSLSALSQFIGRIEPLEVFLLVLALGFAAIAVASRRSLKRVIDANRSFRELYDHIGEGVFRSTLDGRMISANPALVRLNGYETEEELLRAVNNIATEWYVDPNRRAEIHGILLREGEVTDLVSEVYRHKTRERIWIEETTRLVRDEATGEPLFYDGTVREVTEAVRRQELQRRTDKIASIIAGYLYQFRMKPDGSVSMPYASVGLMGLFDVEPEAVVDDARPAFQRIHTDDIERVMAAVGHSARTLTHWDAEFRVVHRNGVEKWIHGQSVPEREQDGSILWHGFLTDISDRKRSERRIYDLAYFDPLTRLPNRVRLFERLKQILVQSGRVGEWGALLFIDLDQFKLLNDTKGHHIGDKLLAAVAERLRERMGNREAVARIGGDEFVILLPELGPDASEAEGRARHVGAEILALVGAPYELEGFPFQTTASMGVTLFRGYDTGLEEVLKRADLAMYEAKAHGRGSLVVFEPRMQELLEARLLLGTELREALKHGGLSMVYQPLVDGSGRPFGAEALLRWNHPERGMIEPGEFLALAEMNGLAPMIDRFVLWSACQRLTIWAKDPLTAALDLAINITARQLARREFLTDVREALEATGADPHRLTFELTEHVMLGDVVEVTEAMRWLKEKGIKLALDDFGTGYSSLSYLKRLPIDMLKIDRSFVRDLESDRSDRVIVQTIVNIARNLDVTVLAEGVETEMQAMILRQLGCHAYQGYLFARPMPADAFLAYINAQEAGAVVDRRQRA